MLFPTVVLRIRQEIRRSAEAEFLDVIGTKVLRVFLLAMHSHLYQWIFLPPPPLSKWFEAGFNVG